jgi:uncharacterized membrane protein YhaH (DUF805 family)
MISRIFPKELNRIQYLLRIVLYIAAVFLIYSIAGGAIAIEKTGLLLLGLQIPKIILLDVPRIRHIGRSPLFLVLLLIPYLGMIFQILLLVLPSDRPPTWRETPK